MKCANGKTVAAVGLFIIYRDECQMSIFRKWTNERNARNVVRWWMMRCCALHNYNCASIIFTHSCNARRCYKVCDATYQRRRLNVYRTICACSGSLEIKRRILVAIISNTIEQRTAWMQWIDMWLDVWKWFVVIELTRGGPQMSARTENSLGVDPGHVGWKTGSTCSMAETQSNYA